MVIYMLAPKGRWLRFRRSWEFNQALLSKIGWWILSGKDCPCVNVLRAKYKVRRNWINHQTVGSPSMIWRSIESIKHLISHSACILVGNGNSIRIWEDPWIIDLPNFILRPKEWTNPDNALMVSQLIN